MSTDFRTTLWGFLAAGDRETLTAGVIAWLLDPRGDHGLGEGLLADVYDRLGFSLPDSETVRVVPEDRQSSGRRFDIAVYDAQQSPRFVLEVKCKTFGTAWQLTEYSATAPVIRLGYGEWNWDLGDEQSGQFPLLTLDWIGCRLAQLGDKAATGMRDFVRGVGQYLVAESQFFRDLRSYFLDESPSYPDALVDQPRSNAG